MKYFIADTHFTEDSIIRYESRPFQSVQEMDRILVERWNSAVAEEDEVFMLGDFGAVGREAEFLGRLQGRKFLVKGNHDRKSNQYYRLAGFEEVYDHPVIIEGFWILSHEPLYVNSHMPYGNLFGHVHNSPIFRTFSAQHYCVSVERTGYAPVSFEEIRRKIQCGIREEAGEMQEKV